jgi:hypothetical protein
MRTPIREYPPLASKVVCIGGDPLCEYQNADLTCRWSGECRHKARVMVKESMP